jgi:hypothetical protein
MEEAMPMGKNLIQRKRREGFVEKSSMALQKTLEI